MKDPNSYVNLKKNILQQKNVGAGDKPVILVYTLPGSCYQMFLSRHLMLDAQYAIHSTRCLFKTVKDRPNFMNDSKVLENCSNSNKIVQIVWNLQYATFLKSKNHANYLKNSWRLCRTITHKKVVPENMG